MKKLRKKGCFYIVSLSIIVGCSGKDTNEMPLKTQVQTMYESYRGEFPGIGEVSVDELREWLSSEDLILVDVREEKEQTISMIEGAITRNEYESELDEYTGKKVVAYCTIGYRSGLYVKELKSRGIEAFNLQGSILAWVNAGMPLRDEKGKTTNRVHVYDKKWNLIPEEYEGVW